MPYFCAYANACLYVDTSVRVITPVCQQMYQCVRACLCIGMGVCTCSRGRLHNAVVVAMDVATVTRARDILCDMSALSLTGLNRHKVYVGYHLTWNFAVLCVRLRNAEGCARNLEPYRISVRT